jgi:putative glutathione S-transferase
MGPQGWHFSDGPGCIPDNINNAKLLREIYFKCEPEYSGRFTVPVLFDKKLSVIVNNESSEIIRMLYTEFDEWSSNPGTTYYPEALRVTIDELNAWIYDSINNGVYKAGFATTQQAYDAAVKLVFDGIDRVEEILSTKEFLCGPEFTEADLRLFPTLVRFDPVYHTHFKCNKKTISSDYPHTLRWLRRVYQIDGIADTVNMEHIKNHYYMSHKQLNPFGIVPVWNGPKLD